MTSISFKRALLAAAVSFVVSAGSASAAEITGAGATFPYPVYAKWAEAYKASSGVALNYQSIGSGGGIKQIKAKTVDFGASDKPLEAKELDEAGLVQWPQIMGGVVPVTNIQGIKPGDLKLDGLTLANIYLGTITKWNDPAIAKLNPGLKLPDQAIAVVHRSDGSGTTFLFTSYLSDVSPVWAEKVKADAAVEWPVGLGGKGNEGVANFVGQTAGSIGYVEYAYALQNKLNWTVMGNKDGNFVKPDDVTFKAAAANADWAHAPGYRVVLVNQPGKESWPITGASFILIHKTAEDPAKTAEVLKFFAWSFANGAKSAQELDYVAMPDAVAKLVQETWAKEIKGADGKPVWPAK
jgi:phosphate transport system substrate-binding protein